MLSSFPDAGCLCFLSVGLCYFIYTGDSLWGNNSSFSQIDRPPPSKSLWYFSLCLAFFTWMAVSGLMTPHAFLLFGNLCFCPGGIFTKSCPLVCRMPMDDMKRHKTKNPRKLLVLHGLLDVVGCRKTGFWRRGRDSNPR